MNVYEVTTNTNVTYHITAIGIQEAFHQIDIIISENIKIISINYKLTLTDTSEV